ncbi:MAG: FtsX-like permease family protein [Propionicimonas sp.]
MLRQVLREIRFHPARFVATLVAIAISVAFMAGSSVLVATEQNGVERQQSLPIAGADVVLTAEYGTDPATLRDALGSTPGVAAFEPSLVRQLSLRQGAVTSLMNLIGVPSAPLRWSEVQQGRWPQAVGEIALTRGAAAALGVGLGGQVTSGLGDGVYTVVGLTAEPSSLFLQTGYVAPAEFARLGVDPSVGEGTWLVRAAGEVTVEQLTTGLRAALAGQPGVTVESAHAIRAEAVRQLAGEFDVFRNLLWAFAAIAAVVGMITIANTFTILLAQRRRQIGLLRAVGASGAQVRRRFLAEAVALGVLGSAAGIGVGIGIATAGAALTGSLYWGVELPALDLVVAFVTGVAITVLAAYLPVLRGTRVRPLEALQPEPASDERRRAGAARGAVCGVLVVAGLALALGWLGSEQALPLAVAGSALMALGVLFGSVLFVPAVLRGLAAVVGWFGVTARLAGQNAVRNPRRAAATATALMVAVGLIVTLQVGTATVSGTVLAEIDRTRPVDLAVGSWEVTAPLPDGLADRLVAAPGVAGGVLLPVAQADFTRGADTYQGLTVIGFVPGVTIVASGAPSALADDQVLVTENSADASDGERVTLAGRDATVELTVVRSTLVQAGEVMVSGATLERLGGVTPGALLWMSVPDRDDAATAAGAVTELVDTDRYYVTGAVLEAAAIESVLGVLLIVTTALLGVAVLIALLGVSNTLGLSVLERTRESALMRALGLQARSLRLMLLLEALLLAGVGVAVGVAAGVFFGWLGAAAIAAPMGVATVTLSVDLAQTVGMVIVAVLAAALASVLPGRRAAKASPTQALADI